MRTGSRVDGGLEDGDGHHQGCRHRGTPPGPPPPRPTTAATGAVLAADQLICRGGGGGLSAAASHEHDDDDKDEEKRPSAELVVGYNPSFPHGSSSSSCLCCDGWTERKESDEAVVVMEALYLTRA